MTTPLLNIEIASIYFTKTPPKTRINLPPPLNQCTPDMREAIKGVEAELETKGVRLFLSDLFRSHDMQLQSHIENQKKNIVSPLPGGSMHEAGRAFDLDLDTLLANNKITLKEFWVVAKSHGLFPIISEPKPGVSEAWHFDCRGSHNKVRQYYLDGKGNNMNKYTAMAVSAILAIGVHVDRFGNSQKAAAIQCALIRLGHELGNIDGSIGNKTKGALEAAGVQFADENTMLKELETQLQRDFPGEFEV